MDLDVRSAQGSQPKQQVLHIDSGVSFRGGQRQVLLLARAQQHEPNGPYPRLLACSTRLIDEATHAGLDVRPWRGPHSAVGLWQLWRVIANSKNTILHVHDSLAHGAVRLVASGQQQQRLIVHRRIDDPPHQRWMTRWKYKRGQLICVSAAIVEVMAAFGVDRRRLHLVRSALPGRTRTAPIVQHRRAPHERSLRLLSVGALVPHKGHRVLLDALARSGGTAHLKIVGVGPLRKELQDLVDHYELGDRVELLGDFAGIDSDLAWADLLVHPSITEGLGTAVLEAMWAGLPVLASNVGGLPELVDNGVTGWLVEGGDPEVLSEKLDELSLGWQQDTAFLGRRGEAGYERAREHFSFAVMVCKISEVYDGDS